MALVSVWSWRIAHGGGWGRCSYPIVWRGTRLGLCAAGRGVGPPGRRGDDALQARVVAQQRGRVGEDRGDRLQGSGRPTGGGEEICGQLVVVDHLLRRLGALNVGRALIGGLDLRPGVLLKIAQGLGPDPGGRAQGGHALVHG